MLLLDIHIRIVPALPTEKATLIPPYLCKNKNNFLQYEAHNLMGAADNSMRV
jgi:hypothetical protein